MFVVAGASKLRDPERFAQALSTFGDPFARVAVKVVPAGEIALGLWLASGVAARLAALSALCVLAAFSWALVRLERSGEADCGCFGAQDTGGFATGLVRNTLLAAACAAVGLEPGDPWAIGFGQVAGAACVAVGLICLWQLLFALRKLWSGRLVA